MAQWTFIGVAMEPAVWAAFAQAVLTAGALLIAIIIPSVQHTLSVQREKIRLEKQRVFSYSMLHEIANHFRAHFIASIKLFNADDLHSFDMHIKVIEAAMQSRQESISR